MKNTADRKNLKPRKMLSRITAMIFLACLFLLSTCLFFTTQSKFVTELGWHDGETGGSGGSGGYGDLTIGSKENDIDYSANTPTTIKTQIDLINAIKSGYTYVQLDGALTSPLLITGQMLQLIGDMTIDLNGNEIERNDTESILTIPAGKRLTIIDTAGGGGLYNPIGSVLNITGGELNVFGGVLESGPRPEEYVGNLKKNVSDITTLGAVNLKKHPTLSASTSAQMPIFPIRDKNGKRYGNLYVDNPIKDAGGKIIVDADTYFYMMVNGETSGGVATFDMSEASYLYEYELNGENVVVFGYRDVIKKSEPAAGDSDPPHYAAVRMTSGELNVNVTVSGGSGEIIRDGSFYSYFGTKYTSCIYQTGGEIDISTNGSFATVDPAKLPQGDDSLLARKSMGSCIISQGVMGADGKVQGGVINVSKLASAQVYNGSIISMMGGTLTMNNCDSLTKTASMSETNSYRFRTELRTEDSAASVAPENRMRTDAAIFINGGTCSIRHTKITLTKEINLELYDSEHRPGNFEVDDLTKKKETCLTTFGVLSRGWVGNAGDLTLTGCDFDIKGSYSYGVFATRGNLTFNKHDNETNAEFNIDNANNSYGIYAYNRANTQDDPTAKPVNITLNGITINLGDKTTFNRNISTLTEAERVRNGLTYNSAEAIYEKNAVVGVYLNSNDNPGGRIDVEGAIIHSTDIGIALYGGDLTFRGTGEIHAYNGSAVGVRGGNLTFGDSRTGVGYDETNYTITCEINRLGDGVAKNADGKEITCNATKPQIEAAGTHAYEVGVPWQNIADEGSQTQEEELKHYENTNCIRVIGGSFYSYDDLTVNFRGLYNDYVGIYTPTAADPVVFDNVVIKSFAICCTQQKEDVPANVTIRKGTITNTVGGGVKVDGGNIVLGHEGGSNSDITVTTKGRAHLEGEEFEGGSNAYLKDPNDESKTYSAYGDASGKSGNLVAVATAVTGVTDKISDNCKYGHWKFYPNVSGGHAVVSRGGSITVYNGTYTAAYANGVTASGEDAEIDVRGGVFQGNMEHTVNHYVMIWGGNRYIGNAGPASHFGMKVMSNAKVNVYDGKFDGKCGGLFVRGNKSKGDAIVKIYKGEFGSASGQDGINIFSMSKVYFGAYGSKDLSGKTPKDLIKVYANSFPLAMNSIYTDKQTDVYVYYGTYEPTTRGDKVGIVSLDTAMTNLDFFIYNYGNDVASVSGINAALLRWNANDTRPIGVSYGYDNTGGGIYCQEEVKDGVTIFSPYTGLPSVNNSSWLNANGTFNNSNTSDWYTKLRWVTT